MQKLDTDSDAIKISKESDTLISEEPILIDENILNNFSETINHQDELNVSIETLKRKEMVSPILVSSNGHKRLKKNSNNLTSILSKV